MDFNSWLTIISVVLAFIALYPKDELQILRHRFHNIEIFSYIFLILLFIPFLIAFYKIGDFIGFINKPTTSADWALEPRDIASVIFYILAIYMFIRITIWKGELQINETTKKLFEEKLAEESFPTFFRFFTKHTDVKLVIDNSKKLESILTNINFMRGLSSNNTNYIASIWEIYEGEYYNRIIELMINNSESELIDQMQNPFIYSSFANSIFGKIHEQDKTITILNSAILFDFENEMTNNLSWVKSFNQRFTYDEETIKYGRKIIAYLSYYEYFIICKAEGKYNNIPSPKFFNLAKRIRDGFQLAQLEQINGVLQDFIVAIQGKIQILLIQASRNSNQPLFETLVYQMIGFLNTFRNMEGKGRNSIIETICESWESFVENEDVKNDNLCFLLKKLESNYMVSHKLIIDSIPNSPFRDWYPFLEDETAKLRTELQIIIHIIFYGILYYSNDQQKPPHFFKSI